MIPYWKPFSLVILLYNVSKGRAILAIGFGNDREVNNQSYIWNVCMSVTSKESLMTIAWGCFKLLLPILKKIAALFI